MNSIILKSKKQYDLADLVRRSEQKDVKRIYYRVAKKADKMQKDMLKQAASIK